MAKQPRILAGETAAITGAARGIGRATAQAFLRQGMRVAIGDVDEQAARKTAAELGPSAVALPLDVTDRGSFTAFLDAAERELGPIDVLVNNAGVQVRSVGIEADDAEWEKVVGVNQRGVFLGMRTVIPGMVRSGGGSIVNVSSVSALVGIPGSIPYQGSKAAVLGLTRGAAVSYGSDNIRVNAICPGLVVTGMTATASAEAVEALKAQIPLGRDGRPDEISGAVVFLASDESSYITGAVLPVDGGFSSM
jgi:NAD(P)-dependent dehydrogenase (short-subunit alcohol dehydrogenase family)